MTPAVMLSTKLICLLESSFKRNNFELQGLFSIYPSIFLIGFVGDMVHICIAFVKVPWSFFLCCQSFKKLNYVS